MKLAILLGLTAAIALSAQNPLAQTPPLSTPQSLRYDEPISTDRPAVAAASTVVPFGSIQIENGFLMTRDHGQSVFDGPESALRFGVGSNFELRFSTPDYFYDSNGPGTGLGDIAIGVKRQLGPVAGFDVSLIGFLSLPTGANAVSSHGYDPGVQLAWSRKLSENWTAGVQLAAYFPTECASPNVTGESTFLVDRQLTNAVDAFIEYAADIQERDGTRELLHFGAAYKIGPRQQIDAHYGVGLSRAGVGHIIGVGYSVRFDTIHR